MKSDINIFLSNISQDDFAKLGNLIMTDQIDESLELSCELVNRHFNHIPKMACKHYGEYILYLIKNAVREHFKKRKRSNISV